MKPKLKWTWMNAMFKHYPTTVKRNSTSEFASHRICDSNHDRALGTLVAGPE